MLWFTFWSGCSGARALERVWHEGFEIRQSRSAQVDDGDCDPEVSDDDVAPFGFLAVSLGVPDIASLYLCSGPEDADCPLQPVGNIWIREWTENRLEGEAGTSSVFGDLCTLTWSGIDATRTDDGLLHIELRQGTRTEDIAEAEACAEALDAVMREECDALLVLDGPQTSGGR